MHYVYFLQSQKRDHIYIGYTKNLEKRPEEHNSGKNYATRRYAPFRLVYYEAYLHPADAINREYKLKHHGSVIGHLKKRLNNSLLYSIQKGGVKFADGLTAYNLRRLAP